ncbi:YbgA family protein [Vibrio palustris]|uniref:DUF1722 domain-containing protein n=1 Tax=Vibrio palustris TaxID=1918946 RepID=A0A1R4B658_9VIBR|nr:2-thiouracil desulfurase family protein [Vibrio palustris]SJL84405.1 hypothetical protein VPAL9027_02389 [Vibrio palustris]
MTAQSILIGISACVLGEQVRFDGGHKRNAFVNDELASFAQFLPICPEVAIGMPIPRKAIRLIQDEERVALVETKDESQDYTDTMNQFSKDKALELTSLPLCGYVVCAKSPTCGMERVKVYRQNFAEKDGVGLYTRQLQEQLPWLPIEEDGRLHDDVLRENFVTRVFSLHDLYESLGDNPTVKDVVNFHSRYKLMLMAHHPQSYRSLGRMVANIKNYDLGEFIEEYRLGLMNALSHRASRKNNTNVLMHFQGYFKRDLSKTQKAELTQVIHDYRKGVLPLLAPVTLIKHYLTMYPDEYLSQQRYLEPYPQELKLRYGL